VGIPGDFTQYMDLIYDMLLLAFQTDTTRIATRLLAYAGGAIQTGRYVKATAQPMSNLFVSMLNTFGVETTEFGDSTGRLAEI